MAASPAAVLPSAQVVGNAFVEQYYYILHQSPELVHKFYQDSSILSRPETSGLMSSVTTMQAIDEKIQSLDYKNFKAEIKSADAQVSHHAGFIVLVTGCLTGKDNVKRQFAQTFFLAPQEKGYFVQNDVFRYVEESAPSETTSTSVENVVDTAQADLAVPNSDSNPTYDSTTTLAAEDLNNGPEVCDPEDNEGSGLVEEVVDESAPVQTSPKEAGPFQKPDPSATQEEKKSYASIVRVTKITGSSGSGHVQSSSLKWAPANTDQIKSRTAKPSPEPETLVPVVVNGPESSKDYDNEGHSIYIRNLPMNATVKQLEEVFKKFGPIKGNGIQVRSHKQQGFCFGFVEFMSSDSMHSAIKAPSITIGDQQVVVEDCDNGHSIYIRNLPMNATVKQIEEKFKKFGPIKGNGIQVRSHKQQGFCFGFVEFMSSDSMHSAIKAPSITIGDQQVVVEEKITTTRVGSGGGGRGRYPSGRGGGFRGRGGYFGGRSFGKNEFRYQGEFPNRSKGSTRRNSEVYQQVDHNGNGNGRLTHPPDKDTEPGQ